MDSMSQWSPWSGGAITLALLASCCPHMGARTVSANGTAAAAGSETAPEARTTTFVAGVPASDVADLGPAACFDALRAADIAYEHVPSDLARRVAMPVRLTRPVAGVQVVSRNGSELHQIVDCRLAVALLGWAPSLRARGVVKLEHYSTYRPGARVRRSGKPSGHARAMAVDAARFHLEDGRVLDVDEHWQEHERGGPACPRRDHESEDAQLVRGVVCDAIQGGLFQVVLTPHHDRDHKNHVHLELVPDVDWTYVR